MSAVLGAILGTGVTAPWMLADAAARRRCARLGEAPDPAAPQATTDGVDVTVLLGLVGAATSVGAAVPRALAAAGDAVGGLDGAALQDVAAALRLGATWTEAWARVPGRLAVVGHALRPAWEEGAAPGTALDAAADELLRARRGAARTAAGRLAVRLVLPLGACFLPAFVLVGLVPVLLALGSGLLGG